MKVLLVDDEMFTIRMLQSLIPWEDLGLSVIGYALNGVHAYDLIVREKPDIIISDIRMPEMDGIELLKKIKEMSIDCKVILLSAYADFTYAKEAIKYGSSDYLLKPIDELELEQSLKKVISEVQGSKNQQKVIMKSEQQLLNLTLFQYMRTGDGVYKLNSLNPKHYFNFDQYFLMMIQLMYASIDDYDNSSNMEMIHGGYLTKIMAKFLDQSGQSYILFDYERGLWTSLVERSGLKKREDFSKELIEFVYAESGIHVTVCFSSLASNIQQLPSLYDDLRVLSKYSFYIGDEDVLGYNYNCNITELNEVRDSGLIKDIDYAIGQKDMAKLLLLLKEAFELSKVHNPTVMQKICEICAKTVKAFGKHIPYKEAEDHLKAIFDQANYEWFEGITSFKELKEAMYSIVETMGEFMSDEKTISYSKPVKDSMRLIDRRYKENLSLEEICQEVAVSKNYFSYLFFKRETGVTVWGYLTTVRLQHAKDLLESTDKKKL